MPRTGLHVALLPKDSQQSQELVRGANMRSKSALDSVGAESKFRYYSTYITLYCSTYISSIEFTPHGRSRLQRALVSLITVYALAFGIRFTYSFVATFQSAITTTARPGTVLEAAQNLYMLECFTFLVCIKLSGHTLDVESVATKERKSEVTAWMVMD